MVNDNKNEIDDEIEYENKIRSQIRDELSDREIENELDEEQKRVGELRRKEKEEQSEWTKPIEKEHKPSFIDKLGKVLVDEVKGVYKRHPTKPAGLVQKYKPQRYIPKQKTVYIERPVKQNKPISKLDIPLGRGAAYDSGIYSNKRSTYIPVRNDKPYDSGMYSHNKSQPKRSNTDNRSAINILFGNTKSTSKHSLGILSGNMSALSTMPGLHYHSNPKPKPKVIVKKVKRKTTTKRVIKRR
jgi:hypothetical protein